jgi:hypothetical protein
MSAFSLRNQGISGPIADVAGTTLLTDGVEKGLALIGEQ